MKRQGGFTLIELVVVIVILGILAVTAAPRFLNLQDDARNSTLEGLKGAVQGAVGIVYGKAAIDGIEGATTQTKLTLSDGTEVETIYGYPLATTEQIAKIVDGLSTGTDDDFQQLKTDGKLDDNTQWVTFGFAKYTKQCVKYTMAKDANTPAKVEIAKGDASCKA
ncbi:type II secretion system protein [Vibrio sp. CAU 1672]|uniref:type II secretion system protein n=1 Tax=Vibrio sp. CAU 1672 TaxID=3032594 RepID=UPI0023DBCB54|nr:type II secretion system protein [Vibrio sp. CAU 1672]MDF2155629.1 type II secretion system protein [Vibrio sp. CAU 1672]